jgi:hypothetical protein
VSVFSFLLFFGSGLKLGPKIGAKKKKTTTSKKKKKGAKKKLEYIPWVWEGVGIKNRIRV